MSSIFWGQLSRLLSFLLTLPLKFKFKNTTKDDRLLGMVEPVEVKEDLVESHWQMTQKKVAAWSKDFKGLLWDSCRAQARPKYDDLAQRIDCIAGWEDLVLPEAQKQVLREVAAHVNHRAKVYGRWGFGGKSNRGLGISALLAGASGTGKTMAAEVLARELRQDLYRIDLSAVISKYIGETEKNLRRVFNAAELGGVILLLEEADALFGKRTEVKDSNDRYANDEVSYLRQRMEAYRGLSVRKKNRKSSQEQAFLRRIRFIVQFPFPDASQRAEIWRRVYPEKTPTDGLDPQKMAQLNVAGRNIRKIALKAAFLAAEAGEAVAIRALVAGDEERECEVGATADRYGGEGLGVRRQTGSLEQSR